MNVQTFQPLLAIYICGNFVNHHWGVQQFIGHCLITLDHFRLCRGVLNNLNSYYVQLSADNKTGINFMIFILLFVKNCFYTMLYIMFRYTKIQ